MRHKEPTTREAACTELRQCLDRTQRQLHAAFSAFNTVSDPDLTESCIYEIRSLQARSDYLLRQLKAAPPPASAKQGRHLWK